MIRQPHFTSALSRAAASLLPKPLTPAMVAICCCRGRLLSASQLYIVWADTPRSVPISGADNPSRCLCDAKPLAENRTLLDPSVVSGATLFLLAFLERCFTCFSRVAMRRFSAATSERYCADAFFSFSVSLRSSLRATRAISSFRTDAIFGNWAFPSIGKGPYYSKLVSPPLGHVISYVSLSSARSRGIPPCFTIASCLLLPATLCPF